MSTPQTDSPSSTPATAPGGEPYPEQKHAGAVGYGPNYHRGPTTGDKVKGYEEELKGKIMHKPDLVEHGREMRTGELQQKEQEDDSGNPFKNAGEDKSPATAPADTDKRAKQQASTVAPEGTRAAETQKEGEAVQGTKTIG